MRRSVQAHELRSASRIWTALLVAACIGAPLPSEAYINPDYTPADLVFQSEWILLLELGPPGDDGKLDTRIIEAIPPYPDAEAEAPEEISLALDTTSRDLLDAFRRAVRLRGRTRALLFKGTYEGVTSDEDATAAALLRAGSDWFEARRDGEGGSWTIREDSLNLKAVWDGGVDMLEAVVRYCAADGDAMVPVRAGVQWRDRSRVATVEGEVHDMLPVQLSPGKTSLFVAAGSGDRLLRWDAARKAVVDITKEVGLESRSLRAAWGDLEADGRPDLASWDGKDIGLWIQRADGTFSRKSLDLDATWDCLGLSIVSVGRNGEAGILVSTPAEPVLLTPGADGAFTKSPLRPPEEAGFPGTGLGTAGPCLVADFGGDSFADVLQPYSKGGLYYAGTEAGSFAPPVLLQDVRAGEGALRATTGDYDADGRLDVLLTDDGGCHIWRNLGGGKFEGRGRSSGLTVSAGELDYISRPHCLSGSTCDINNDGRQDILLTYRSAQHPQLFFNRGFLCFGYSIELCLRDSYPFEPAGEGQQAGCVTDVDEDGAQDLALVLANGEVWILYRAWVLDRGILKPPLAVEVLPGKAPGPLKVTGSFLDRSLGAWSIRAGSSAFFGLEYPGVCELRWQLPGGSAQKAQVSVEKGRVVFPVAP